MTFAKRLGLATLGVLAITIAIAGTIAASLLAVKLMGPGALLGAKLVFPPILAAGLALAYVGVELLKKSEFKFGFTNQQESPKFHPSPRPSRSK